MRVIGFVLIVSTGSACVAGSPDDAEISGRTSTIVDEFGSLGATAPSETAHWGQLAGRWDCILPAPGTNEEVEPSRATWTWRYILDGHAVQDVYVGHRTDGRADFYGTGLRIFNPNAQAWEVTWVANTIPVNDGPRTTHFTATSTGQEIVMRRADGDPEWRVVFHDIGDGGFSWKSEPSGQTMRCTRDAS